MKILDDYPGNTYTGCAKSRSNFRDSFPYPKPMAHRNSLFPQRLMPFAHRHMSYEFCQKYFGTKLVSIERSCNPEHFDMHLKTVHFMVPEILDSEVCVF